MTRGTESSDSRSGLTFKWPHVALAAIMITVASLSTLTVIAAIENVDTLATVALVLAILAFIIQIVVFIAQSWTSGQQMLQSQTINAETKALLAELRESARATNDLVTRQFDRVLEQVLSAAADELSKADGSVDVQSLRDRIRDELGRAIRSESGGAVGAAMIPRRGRNVPITPDRMAHLEHLQSYPTAHDELAQVVEAIQALSDTALSSLYSLTDDMLFSIEFGRRIGQSGDTLTARDELDQHGLIEPATDYPNDSGFITLSIKGESIGRILTAEGKAPAELASILERIKRVAEAERKNT